MNYNNEKTFCPVWCKYYYAGCVRQCEEDDSLLSKRAALDKAAKWKNPQSALL